MIGVDRVNRLHPSTKHYQMSLEVEQTLLRSMLMITQRRKFLCIYDVFMICLSTMRY